ncbi:MAG: esterase family protein [Saprospiraceae bacterium]|nr:esterase family protein [Saprospiraceae bacterium]
MYKNFFIFILIIFSLNLNAATVDTVLIKSVSMDTTYKAAVILPSSYAGTTGTYPVVYLLHGAGGHFDSWLTKTPDKNFLKNLADHHEIIIVLPEGEVYSWYLDSQFDKKSQFETHIIKEVVPKIDALYKTVKDRQGRAISGYSMGGHGALYLATRHPEVFCAAGSMSGGVDMNYSKFRFSGDLTRTKQEFQRILGTSDPDSEAFRDNSVINMVDEIKKNGLAIIIDCGVDDYLLEVNRALHERLVYQNVSHDYTERPGGHTWAYWENAVSYQMLFFEKIFKNRRVSAG